MNKLSACMFCCSPAARCYLVIFGIVFLSSAPAEAQQLDSSILPNTVRQSTTDFQRIPIHEVKLIAKDDLDSAIELLHKIIYEERKKQHHTETFEAYLALAATYLHKNDYRLAGDAYQYAMAYSVKTNTPYHDLCRALNGIGYMHLLQGNYSQAAKHLFAATQIGESRSKKDTTIETQLIEVYNNLSSALIELKEFNKALSFLSRAEHIATKTPNSIRLATIWNNMAATYNKTKMQTLAWEFGQKALEHARDHAYYHAEYNALQTLASIKLELNEPKEAIQYLLSSLEIEGNSNASYAARTFYLLGCAYEAINETSLSQHYFNLALKKAKEAKSADIALRSHTRLSHLHQHKGDYHKAYQHLSASYQLRDSLMDMDKTAAVYQLETKYRTTQKDYELAQKQLLLNSQEQLLQRKNLWIGGTTIGAGILTILLVMLQRNYRHKLSLHLQQLEIDSLKSTMKGEERERTRIARELHDGISGMITAVKLNFTSVQNEYQFLEQSNQFSEAMLLLEHTAQEIRKTAHNLTPEVLSQHSLPDAIQIFCRQLQKNSTLRISFQAYGTFDHLETEVKLSVYRIVQELVNNVIKHADASNVIVQLSCHDDLFGITVEDDGVGIDPNKKTDGIGLHHVTTRVQSLNGKWNIQSTPGNGTTVYIEFKIQMGKQEPAQNYNSI